MEIIKIKNSCNGRGCSIRIILPHDRRVVNIDSKMHGTWNDIQAVLRFTDVLLDKVA